MPGGKKAAIACCTVVMEDHDSALSTDQVHAYVDRGSIHQRSSCDATTRTARPLQLDAGYLQPRQIGNIMWMSLWLAVCFRQHLDHSFPTVYIYSAITDLNHSVYMHAAYNIGLH